MTQKKKLTRAEEKLLIAKMVQLCQDRAAELMKKWKPSNKSWPTKKGGAYIRLSTEHQVLVDGGSLEQQINQAFDEMTERSKEDQINYQIVAVFIDAAISGQTDDRAEFRRLQVHVRKGKLAFVIIKDVARLFRHAFLFSQFFEGCNAVGCEVMFKGLPVNPNDPNDVLKLRMLAAIAEFEARNTSKRVRENVYSAMVHNGKFNATHKMLGFDQLEVNGSPMVGLYKKNPAELRIVEWIMETFIRVASYQVTLDEINNRGIKNKNGREFKKNSLTTLLTNMKYIGKWELNAENKDKPTKKLMPYEQHRIVDLPHGCVIDRELWDKVQKTVERLKGSKAKNCRIERSYPLSGLLRYVDGTTFGGSANWGRTKKSYYYMNCRHGFRLSAEAVELEARKTVTEIIKQSPKLQQAIVDRTNAIRSSLDLLQKQMEIIDAKLAKAKADRIKLDKRLDFLLSTDNETQAESFREEYVEAVNKLNVEAEDLQRQKTVIETSRTDLQEDELNTTSLVAKAEKIQALIQAKEPAALKNAYHALFGEIVVGEVDKNGQRKLEFRIRGSDPLEGVLSGGTKSGIVEKMAHQSWSNTTISAAKNLSMISTYQSTPLYRNEEILRHLYLEKGLSTRQIAREICSARSTVKGALGRFRIPVRPEDEAHRLNKGQLAYGERMVNGQIVSHVGEQKVIGKIVELRRSGSSFGMIVGWLNSRRIPAKNRKQGWDRPTVFKILRRHQLPLKLTCASRCDYKCNQ